MPFVTESFKISLIIPVQEKDSQKVKMIFRYSALTVVSCFRRWLYWEVLPRTQSRRMIEYSWCWSSSTRPRDQTRITTTISSKMWSSWLFKLVKSTRWIFCQHSVFSVFFVLDRRVANWWSISHLLTPKHPLISFDWTQKAFPRFSSLSPNFSQKKSSDVGASFDIEQRLHVREIEISEHASFFWQTS